MGNGLDTIYFIMLIVGGLFGVSDYFAGKSEKMKDFVGKIVPAQGVIGLIVVALSVIEFIRSFFALKYSFVFWLLFLFLVLLSVVLGAILSYKLIVKLFLEKNEEAKEKTAKLVGKLQAWQTPLGWANLTSGILMFLFMGAIQGIVKSAFSAAIGG